MLKLVITMPIFGIHINLLVLRLLREKIVSYSILNKKLLY